MNFEHHVQKFAFKPLIFAPTYTKT